MVQLKLFFNLTKKGGVKMDYLVSLDRLPPEMHQEIVFYVCDGIVTDKKSKPEDYNALAHVAETCKQWDLLVRNRVEHHYSQVAVKSIGRSVWQELGANVGEVPRFPLIFYPDVASGEFILTWIPEYLNGKPMRDPKTIDEFCKGRHASIYRFPLPAEGIAAETSKPFKSHWFLMSVDVLEGTRGESFAKQEQMVKGAGYEMAHMIGAITSILLHQKRTGECLYPNGSGGQQWTYTRVQERINRGVKFKIIVGGLSPLDLGVRDDCYSDRDRIGAARARKSIGSWPLAH
jgi:hypothetical protein